MKNEDYFYIFGHFIEYLNNFKEKIELFFKKSFL